MLHSDVLLLLQLVVDPSGPAFDLEIPLEILVGTIPMRNVPSFFATETFCAPPQYNLSWGMNQEEPIQNQPGPYMPPPLSNAPSAPSDMPRTNIHNDYQC